MYCCFVGSHKYAEAMRKKLQTMQERKATLVAEVRYILFTKSLTIYHEVLDVCFSSTVYVLFIRFLWRRYRHLRQESQPVMQPTDVKKGRGRSNGGKKSKTQLIRVEVSPTKTSEAETKHVSLPDLNHSGEVHHEETKTKKVPLFDLNQISVSTL